MSDPSMEDNLRLAHELADIADVVTLSRFGAANLVIDEKPDGSPVTDADTLVEERLRARLRRARPQHAVTGEEGGDAGAGGPWRWLLDPIDGTVCFARHEAGWATLIALVHEDKSCLGLVSDPLRGTRWWAVRGGGAYRNGARLHVSTTGRLAEATVSDDWEQTLSNGAPSTCSLVWRRAVLGPALTTCSARSPSPAGSRTSPSRPAGTSGITHRSS
jgi:histidinol-phosphatase